MFKLISAYMALGAAAMATWASIIFVICGIFTFWTQSNLSFYITYFAEKPYEAEYWTSFLVSLVSMLVGGSLLWGNAILSVLRLFL